MADSASFHIVFRTDASLDIGTGHVMRCLALADGFRTHGADCLFLCRAHPGNLMEQIGSRGHRVIALPAPLGPVKSAEKDHLFHDAWLGADWREDASQCRQALAGTHFDWLVVDHYALDRRWENELRPACERLMVIDDLADRQHDCDLLLDPGLGRLAADYGTLIPSSAITLLGPHHALLRPEFAELRVQSLARRRTPILRRLLITMGGVDKDNVTGDILKALATTSLPAELEIKVVLGPDAPALHEVKAYAAQMTVPTEVRVKVNDMARLMTDSDIAIGAGGGTSWERCCLGLPSVILCLAQNQFELAHALEESGAAVTANSPREAAQLISGKIATRTINAFIKRASDAAAGVTDGLGVERVCCRIFE